jgi:geranylgeranyl diphosphate synthase type I
MAKENISPRQLQAAVEDSLQNFLDETRARYDYGEWFDPLYFDFCEYVGRKGKRVRPLMFLMTYQALGGVRSPLDPHILRGALALELFHSFILLHDDVIDRSDLRRGLPTYHKMAARRIEPLQGGDKIGENIATVFGDIVYTMALDALLDMDLPAEHMKKVMKIFLRAAADTGSGEIYDILLGARDVSRIERAEVERMYTLKTTQYTFELPCLLGAVIANATEDQCEAIRGMSYPLGLAFQMDNDLQEFRRVDVKSHHFPDDLVEGKRTLLVCMAYERLSEVDRSFLQMCLASQERTEARLIKLHDLIVKSGAVAALQDEVVRLFQEAERKLDHPSINPVQRAQILEGVSRLKEQIGVVAVS